MLTSKSGSQVRDIDCVVVEGGKGRESGLKKEEGSSELEGAKRVGGRKDWRERTSDHEEDSRNCRGVL